MKDLQRKNGPIIAEYKHVWLSWNPETELQTHTDNRTAKDQGRQQGKLLPNTSHMHALETCCITFSAGSPPDAGNSGCLCVLEGGAGSMNRSQEVKGISAASGTVDIPNEHVLRSSIEQSNCVGTPPNLSGFQSHDLA